MCFEDLAESILLHLSKLKRYIHARQKEVIQSISDQHQGLMICFKSMHISLQPLITFESGKFVCSDLVDRSTHISFGVDNLPFLHDRTWTSLVLCCFLEGYGIQGDDHKFQCVPSDLFISITVLRPSNSWVTRAKRTFTWSSGSSLNFFSSTFHFTLITSTSPLASYKKYNHISQRQSDTH